MGLLVKKEPVPVPVRGIDCWPPWALSVTESVPLRVRGCVGVNVTLMVQLALMARLAGQFVVVLKLEVLGCCVIEEMLSAANPVFVRVTFCATLVEPTLVFGKFRVVPESVTSGVFT